MAGVNLPAFFLVQGVKLPFALGKHSQCLDITIEDLERLRDANPIE